MQLLLNTALHYSFILVFRNAVVEVCVRCERAAASNFATHAGEASAARPHAVVQRPANNKN